MTTVWIGQRATAYACLCELCLEDGRRAGVLFSDAIAGASVRGDVAPEVEVHAVRCRAGHEIVLRRAERPPALARPDERQLQLT